MVTPYVRPKSSEYPQVYSRFKAKDLNSDCLVEYYVRDLIEDDYEKAFKLVAKYLRPEETFQRAINVAGKDHLMDLLQISLKSALDEKVSIVCFNSESKDMVGLNALKIKTRGEKKTLQVNKFCISLTHDYV